MNYLKPLLFFKRFVLQKAMTIFSLSAMAFTFQACYGTMQDFENDVIIEGNVFAADTEEPIPSLQIQLKDTYFEANTDQNGFFSMIVPIDTTYMLLVYDRDSIENGYFYNAKERIENPNLENVIFTTIKLSRIK